MNDIDKAFEKFFKKEFHMTYREALDYPSYFTSTPSLYSIKKAYIQARIDTLKEFLLKVEEVFFILKDIPQDNDYGHDEDITDAYVLIEKIVKEIDTELENLRGE